jgi:hypothetical protein
MLDELCRDGGAVAGTGASPAAVCRAGVLRAALMCGHDEQ